MSRSPLLAPALSLGAAVVTLGAGLPARTDVGTDVAPAPPPPAAADPLAEPRALVETAANTAANLKRAIELYEQALGDAGLPARVRSNGWADVSRAYLRWGDLERASATKLALYEKGEAAGQKAEQIDPTNAAAVFWGTANMACVGRTRGVMNSLFMLGDLRKGLNRTLALDANFHFARNTLGEIDHAVPGLAGGSDDRAEQAYTEVLRRNPHFTVTMILMARLKRDQGEKDEARRWAQKVLDEKAPAMPNDWRKLDVPDARALLAALE